MNRRVTLVAGCLWLIGLFGAADPAEAQWYFGGYIGANATKPADVSIAVPAANLSITFHDVEFDARPFESPQYYGWRLGKIFGTRRMIGAEIEFIHLKVIGLTGQSYATSGSPALPAGTPMRAVVERYSMTHGLNFLLANIVIRQPFGSGRAAFVGRAGAGPTIPHTETTVLGGAVDKYEYAGISIHAAAGLDVRLAGRLSLLAEYKLTYARPEITVAGGSGRTTAATHQIAAGLAFGLSR